MSAPERHNVTIAVGRLNRRTERLKRQMRRYGVTYRSVAADGDWSWNHVWRVIQGERTSALVLHSARYLIAAARAAKRQS